jgi:hypothetical protein
MTEAPDPFDALQRLRLRLQRLPELEMRVASVASFLQEHNGEVGIFVLDQLVRGSLRGEESAREALLSVSVLLMRVEFDTARKDPALLNWLYAEASQRQRPHLAAMALSLPPYKELLDKRALLQGPRFEREVSLGERRWMATRADQQALKALLRDHTPMVVHRLCRNPRLKLSDILSLATRRPTLPEALLEVALAPRWIQHRELRLALVQNPYSPTGLGLKLLPLLHSHEIDEIAATNDLEPSLHQLARHLARLRG